MSDFRADVSRALKWQTVLTIGRQLLSVVIFTTLARLLGPADFGLMGLTYVYLALAGVLADQGVSTALIQRSEVRSRHWNSAFWFNVGFASVLALGTIVMADVLAKLLGEPRVASLLQWSSLSLVLAAASSIHQTMFLRALDFRRLAGRALLASLVGGIVGIGMAFSGWGVWALVGQQVTTALVGTVFLWVVSNFRPALHFSWADMRELFGVSVPVFLNGLIWLVTIRIDQLVIAHFSGANALGLYVVAGKVPELAKTAISQPISDISIPALSKLQGDYGRMRQAIYRGMRLNAAVMFAMFFGFAVVADDLVAVLFGRQWAAASGLFALLSIYYLISALQVFSYPALLAAGLNRQYVVLTVAYTIGVLIACLVGIQLGVEYLVMGLIANGLIHVIPSLIFMQRRIGVRWTDYCRPCLAPAGAAMLMVAVVYLTGLTLTVGMDPLSRLSCHVAVGAAAYIVGLSVLNRTIVDELLQTVGAAFRLTKPLPDAPPRSLPDAPPR